MSACLHGYKEDWSCDKEEVMEWDPSGRVGRRRPGKCRLRMSHVFCWGVISRRRLGLDFRSCKAGRIGSIGSEWILWSWEMEDEGFQAVLIDLMEFVTIDCHDSSSPLLISSGWRHGVV